MLFSAYIFIANICRISNVASRLDVNIAPRYRNIFRVIYLVIQFCITQITEKCENQYCEYLPYNYICLSVLRTYVSYTIAYFPHWTIIIIWITQSVNPTISWLTLDHWDFVRRCFRLNLCRAARWSSSRKNAPSQKFHIACSITLTSIITWFRPSSSMTNFVALTYSSTTWSTNYARSG